MKTLVILLSFLIPFSLFAGPIVSIDFDVAQSQSQSDILFVIDNSGSMASHQNRLANLSGILLKELKSVNYQITAINTDINVNEIAPIISPQVNDPIGSLKSLITRFGTNGSFEEMPFHNISTFMHSPEGALFLRKQTPLEIIILTDEEDQSPQSVEDMLLLFEGKKVTVSSLVPLSDSSCSNNPRKNDKIENLTTQTSGILVDICSAKLHVKDDYSDIARQIASRATLGRTGGLPVRYYRLHRLADPNSIKVTFGTQVIPRGLRDIGWTLNSRTKTIYFGRNIKLTQQPSGTKFSIKYRSK
jgi:hypothetical protein